MRPMTAVGQNATSRFVGSESALAPTADIGERDRHVAVGPTGDIRCNCEKGRLGVKTRILLGYRYVSFDRQRTCHRLGSSRLSAIGLNRSRGSSLRQAAELTL